MEKRGEGRGDMKGGETGKKKADRESGSEEGNMIKYEKKRGFGEGRRWGRSREGEGF